MRKAQKPVVVRSIVDEHHSAPALNVVNTPLNGLRQAAVDPKPTGHRSKKQTFNRLRSGARVIARRLQRIVSEHSRALTRRTQPGTDLNVQETGRT